MKLYAQFLTMSTGYIKGSIPPEFKESEKKPIHKLGSDGVFILDARFSLSNLIQTARNKAHKIDGVVGFQIVKAERFTNDGKILHHESI